MIGSLTSAFGEKKTQRILSLIADIAGVLSFVLAIVLFIIPEDPLRVLFLFSLVIGILITIIANHLKGHSSYEDIDTNYSITIKNSSGDAWVQRKGSFINRTRATQTAREHVIFSTSNGMPHFKDIQCVAWDSDGNELQVEPVRDDPTYKRFQVKFNKGINPGITYTYGYKYFWKSLFPADSETFTAKDICPAPGFSLTIPKELSLERMICHEIGKDGQNSDCEEIERDIDTFNGTYWLKVAKKNRLNDVELRFTLER